MYVYTNFDLFLFMFFKHLGTICFQQQRCLTIFTTKKLSIKFRRLATRAKDKVSLINFVPVGVIFAIKEMSRSRRFAARFEDKDLRLIFFEYK